MGLPFPVPLPAPTDDPFADLLLEVGELDDRKIKVLAFVEALIDLLDA